MELFKSTVKNTILLFTVGILVSLAMPLVANGLDALGVMGAEAMKHAGTSMAGAMWTGLVFGGFGAFHTLLMPTFDKLFGDGKENAAVASSQEVSHCKDHSHSVSITNMQMHPELNVAADVAVDRKPGHYAQMVDAQRANAGQSLPAK